MTIDEVMQLSPVIPVLVIDDDSHARPIAEALVAGSLRVLEVTLRTPAACTVISEMARVDGAIVGAGSVVDEDGLERALAAGARFIVTPGLTEPVVKAALRRGVPILPGVATASDIMRGLHLGLAHFKFFPAESLGGIDTLKALSGPFGQCRFCPTGGIRSDNFSDWLALDSVLCVGGTWLVPRGTNDPAQITARARQVTDRSLVSK